MGYRASIVFVIKEAHGEFDDALTLRPSGDYRAQTFVF